MKQLSTERTILRVFRMRDTQDFYDYAKNPIVGTMAGWKPHESLQESETMIKKYIEDDQIWAIEDRASGRVIGTVGLHPDQKRGRAFERVRMLGYGLDEPYWGRGVMPEVCREVLRYAFEELGLDLVSVFHYPFNRRSKRVIEKLGFHYEGFLRDATVLPNGEVTDDLCYSMTRQEYHERYGSASMP